MTPRTDVLIAGAGIAGPTLAYWLSHYGFYPTLVERAPALRVGGHPVDLWGSAVDVMEQMGLLPALEAARTRNDRGTTIGRGHRPVELDLRHLASTLAGRHIEVMRGELVNLLYERTKDCVEYQFGNSITGLEERTDGVTTSFEHGPSRRFGLVIGADGLHSGVRQFAFGAERAFRHDLGGCVAGYTIPDFLAINGRILRYVAPNKTVVAFPIRQSGEAGILFLFRLDEEPRFGHGDTAEQQRLVRALFANEGWEVQRLLDAMGRSSDFYFDLISQIRMGSWSRGRATLVGDAGYAPAPAVGGGTSLAVVGARVLAGALMASRGDHGAAFRHYERQMRDAVIQSRAIGPALMRTLLPRTEAEVWLGMRLAPLVLRLPGWLRQRLVLPRAAARGLTAIASIPLTTSHQMVG